MLHMYADCSGKHAVWIEVVCCVCGLRADSIAKKMTAPVQINKCRVESSTARDLAESKLSP